MHVALRRSKQHNGACCLSGNNISNCYVRSVGCTFRFGNAGQAVSARATVEFYNCSISSDGSAIANIFNSSSAGYTSGGIYSEGCDFSAAASGANIVNSGNAASSAWTLVNCKLPTSFVMRAADGTHKAQGEVTLYNCASGDTHYHIAHADAMGSTIVETTIVANDGASFDGGTTKTSWKIAEKFHFNFRKSSRK
jgi:hypothetical protein